MNYLRDTWARVRAVLVSLPPSQRYTVAALVGLVAVALALLVTGRQKDEYVAVFPISPADMGAIDSALKGTGIKYQISSSEGVLKVVDTDRDKAYMLLSEKNALPKDISASAGFTFDDLVKPQGLLAPGGEQYSDMRNLALGNWIAKTIAASPVVKSARVQISTDTEGYFGPKKATAAVGIVPRFDAELPDAACAGMCRFVAAAVGPTLRQQDVVITNLSTGQTFSLADENSSYARAANGLEYLKSCEKYYYGKIQDFLKPYFGAVQPLVTVKTDATAKKTEEIEYSTTHKTTRTSTGSPGSANAGGEEGVKPNVMTSVETAASAPSGPTSETNDKEETMSPSKTVSTEAPPGEIVDIQLGVIVNQDKLESMIRGKDHLDAKAAIPADRIKRELDAWQTLLLQALPVAGEGEQKISKVTFYAAPIVTTGEIMAAQASVVPASARVFSVVEDNWQRIALIMLSVMALVMIRSIARRGAEHQAEIARIEQSAEEEVALPEPEVDIEQKRANKMRESVEDMIRREPQVAVSLVKRWVSRES